MSVFNKDKADYFKNNSHGDDQVCHVSFSLKVKSYFLAPLQGDFDPSQYYYNRESNDAHYNLDAYSGKTHMS